ncbi:response regulator transcription factor [Deinococcus sp. Arct2-2]|uniref:response regulator transcription factor n=1 Tax=Deinococcus sp. Arct2-2 TaxID=2568653 RepID=UPI003211CE1F
MSLAQQTNPHVVLMDLRMPELDGAAATAQLTLTVPGSRVLVLTVYDSDMDILKAIEAGAVGHLLKDTPHNELFAAVRAVARGERRLASSVAEKLMHRSMDQPADLLTARELQVLSLVADGLSNKKVASKLLIGEPTVKAHLVRVFDKLGVKGRTAAVMAALERGLLRH